jgi:uncharacterized RDD family membrane protein YckC
MGSLASWGTRAVGYLIDAAGPVAVYIFCFILALAAHVLIVLAYLAGLGIQLWWAYQLGETGQTPGMRVMGIKCIGQSTGQPIGFGLAIVRALAHIIDGVICSIGYLFPLWDAQRQTLADKIMSTVVVTVPKQSFSLTPVA